jgi:hypothetical protein
MTKHDRLQREYPTGPRVRICKKQSVVHAAPAGVVPELLGRLLGGGKLSGDTFIFTLRKRIGEKLSLTRGELKDVKDMTQSRLGGGD